MSNSESSASVFENMFELFESAFLCKTVKTKVINKEEIDLNVRFKLEQKESPLFLSLLKTGKLQCKKSDCKVTKSSLNCDKCQNCVHSRKGEIAFIFEVSDKLKCDSCSQLQTVSEDVDTSQIGSQNNTSPTSAATSTKTKSVHKKRESSRKRQLPVKLRSNDVVGDFDSKITADEYKDEIGDDNVDHDDDDGEPAIAEQECKDKQPDTAVTELKSNKFTSCFRESKFKTVRCKSKKSKKSLRSIYECNICDKRFNSKSAIEKHVETHDTHNDATEKACEPTLNTIDSQHQNEDITIKDITKENNDESNEIPNTESDHEQSKSIASNCEVKSNMTESQPTRPVRKRKISSVRPFKCSICGRTYQLLKTLKSHERTHSEEFEYQCTECEKGFHLQSRLKYHMRTHTGERPYKCTVCGSSFIKSGHLTHHMKTHSNRPHICSVCGKGFTEACYLKVHERNHTGEKPYQCDKCGKCFTNSSSFHFHQQCHQTGIFKCEVCGKICHTAKTLDEHQALHSSTRPFTCDYCGRGYILLSRLKRHERTHSVHRPHKCAICNKGFHEASDLKTHARVHSGERPYQCDLCEKKFAMKESLNRHILVHSTSRPHKCDECGKCFASLRQLKKHEVTHTGTKQFVCELCGKCFLTSSSLRSHNQTHAGYRPHKCDICGHFYRSSWYLQVHKKTHTGENLLQCNMCGDWFINPSYFKKHQEKHCKGRLLHCNICSRGFSQNHALQSHMGLHTGERPHGCDICGKAFAKLALLQDHVKRHTEENIHKCSFCGKGFKRTNDLRKHERRHARKMKKQNLPDSLKPGHKNGGDLCVEKDLLQQATESIRDGAMMLGVEVHDMDTPQVVTEQVVLTTIDSSQISEQTTLHMTESGKDIIMSADHHYFPDHLNPVVPTQEIPTTSIHTMSATSDPTGNVIYHTNAAIPVVSSHQITHGLVGESGQLQTLTTLRPPTVPLTGPELVKHHTDHLLHHPIDHHTQLSHPPQTHWSNYGHS